MAYTVPSFNLTCNIWRALNPPPNAAALTGVPCNLAWGKRVNAAIVGQNQVTMTLLLPAFTDIRSNQTASGNDVVEVPAGSGRFYHVANVDDIGKGFPNEHRAASIWGVSTYGFWPAPIP